MTHHPPCPTPDDPPDDHQYPDDYDDWTTTYYGDPNLPAELPRPDDARPGPSPSWARRDAVQPGPERTSSE